MTVLRCTRIQKRFVLGNYREPLQFSGWRIILEGVKAFRDVETWSYLYRALILKARLV